MLVDNRIYVNKSLEPVKVMVVNEKHGIEYTAERLNGKRYPVGSNGLSISRKNQIIDRISLNAMFNDKKVSYITDMFRTVYCNHSGDWFDMSDLYYGFIVSKLEEKDIRFIKVNNKLYTPIVKMNIKDRKNLEYKYRHLRDALKRERYGLDKLKTLLWIFNGIIYSSTS